jgi:uncharacterized membrane protein
MLGETHAVGVIVLAVLLAFLVLWFAPWVTFWAIGVLFGYHIPLTWGTGFAFWVLRLFLFGTGSSLRRS